VIESVGASPVSAPAGFGVEDRLGRAATPGAALEDGEAVALVWEAARALPQRDLEVLDLQLRHGLTPAEIGEVMGMNRNAANQLVHRLKGRLETAIRARVLWRGGDPACPVLATRLRESGIAAFGAGRSDRRASRAGLRRVRRAPAPPTAARAVAPPR
jgi:DNA-binding CsgD family transcriptional regulator